MPALNPDKDGEPMYVLPVQHTPALYPPPPHIPLLRPS